MGLRHVPAGAARRDYQLAGTARSRARRNLARRSGPLTASTGQGFGRELGLGKEIHHGSRPTREMSTGKLLLPAIIIVERV